ncbi:ketoacyl-ACP synthase III [Salinimicrobium sp. MT39]|jgi:3-oxoacyl-[acyl-carrier-protein] synthase-3|uniref:Ketoacyl-ACP synthase III n=1 Tax=Salinimicrobium profundisediminis TaxID=2994553 RepID=A0A9X3I1B4_9FLAO|nr:ketoacyl-ACP synthase III [Salinimicrobium profundisediminis]MCX2838895.1 ketoacyl-ACP synthase III [Salinimicrobium profundisediminis]
MSIKITGVGSYIPGRVEKNSDFQKHEFLYEDGSTFSQPNAVIIEKFKAITGIAERRYAHNELNNSDIAYLAANSAIEDAGIDPEELDYLIVAHNYGDVLHNDLQSDTVPSLATRVKHKLRIKNPKCVAYDILFGCPGWVEAVIQAKAFIQSGMAKKCLVIGSETLSRVIDKHDRDSMIYSDGAGATVIEASEEEGGILAHESATYSFEEANFIFFGKSNNAKATDDRRYIKMHGRKIYEFALSHVPNAMKSCLEKSGKKIEDIKKILIHQANEKMDEAIVKRFYRLYGQQVPEGIMPMSIDKLGNSSVATVPTLLDLILKKKMDGQTLEKGDVIILASVGAGMNINAIVYQF